MTSPVWADIYKLVDKNGMVHLSDRSMGPGSVLILKSKRRPAPRGAQNHRKNRDRLTPLINKVAAKYRLDGALIHAVVQAESAYNSEATSAKGAVGLMQLMPNTAQRYGVKDRKNPTQNLSAGTRYLRDLLLQFNNVTLALAAYNAGENAVVKYGNKVPPYPETQNYVRKVLTYYRENRTGR